MRTAMVSMIADIHTLAKTNSGQKNAAAYAEHVWLFSVKPQTVLITRESSYIRKGRERRE
jgi:hypothetical protein